MAFLGLPSTRVAAVALALCLACPPGARAQQPEAGESTLKAAFLYNFTRYVHWPASAFGGGDAPFQVCVFAPAPFRREVEGMLAGETVGGRPIRILTEPADVRRCHVAYFGPENADRFARMQASLRQSPVLTVGDGRRFLELGGLISFVLEENRVRFDVNKGGFDRAGLTISSKLLRVARHVGAGETLP